MSGPNHLSKLGWPVNNTTYLRIIHSRVGFIILSFASCQDPRGDRTREYLKASTILFQDRYTLDFRRVICLTNACEMGGAGDKVECGFAYKPSAISSRVAYRIGVKERIGIQWGLVYKTESAERHEGRWWVNHFGISSSWCPRNYFCLQKYLSQQNRRFTSRENGKFLNRKWIRNSSSFSNEKLTKFFFPFFFYFNYDRIKWNKWFFRRIKNFLRRPWSR